MRLFRRSVTGARTIIRTGLIGVLLITTGASAFCSANDSIWRSAAGNLAQQIAGALGNGQAHLVLQNIASISREDVVSIRRMVEEELKARGVALTSDQSTNTIRVTLSENARGPLWVAEITRNNETRVVMVPVTAESNQVAASGTELTLHRQVVLAAPEPILAGIEVPGGFIALEREQLVFFSIPNTTRVSAVNVSPRPTVGRDPRGSLFPADQNAFSAWLPGIRCEGSYPDAQPSSEWKVTCNVSDDPWPIGGGGNAGPPQLRAFYNPTRDFFTGVVVPALPTDLPPFYSASLIPHPSGATALLLTRTDGTVMLFENGQLQPMTGTQDWGSDLALLQTGCGQGAQAVASAAGSRSTDTLRVYDINGTDAVPASVPLPMNGPVMALWAASDGRSVFASVRHAATAGTGESYEVDRVTASCN